MATLAFYCGLLFVQNENADSACEDPEAAVSRIHMEDLRGIGFENSLLNPGGRCEYRMDDGSAIVSREPGWWFSGTIARFVAALAGLSVFVAGRKGHPGVLFGLATFLAPPLGLSLAIAAPRRGS